MPYNFTICVLSIKRENYLLDQSNYLAYLCSQYQDKLKHTE